MANELYPRSVPVTVSRAVVTAGIPSLQPRSVPVQTSKATVQLGPPLLQCVSTSIHTAVADVQVSGAGAPTVYDLAAEVLRMWQCVCDGDVETCVRNDVLGVINQAMQFIHMNGKELPFLGKRTRYYYVDGKESVALENDIQNIDGGVVLAVPALSIICYFGTEEMAQEVGYNPFAAGFTIAITVDGDYYRLEFPQDGKGNAETLRQAIQAKILNEARAYVTYVPNGYLKVTFDHAPRFNVTETAVIPARPYVMSIDFTGLDESSGLRSTGFMVREAGGDDDLFWFVLDTIGTQPAGQGDFGAPINIYTGEGPAVWAETTRAVVDTFGPDYSATRVGNVVTITAAYNSREQLLYHTTPKAPLTFVHVQNGSDGVPEVRAYTGPDGMSVFDTEMRPVNGEVVAAYSYPVHEIPTVLVPVRSRSALENFANLYGSSPAQVGYYLDRQHEKAADSTVVTMRFSSPVTDKIMRLDAQVCAPRFSWGDVIGRTVVPIPHTYVESLLFPLVRMAATYSHRYVRRERHETLVQQYKDALTALGIADPQPRPVRDGKEGE